MVAVVKWCSGPVEKPAGNSDGKSGTMTSTVEKLSDQMIGGIGTGPQAAPLKVMIVAGEASSDLHAAALINNLRELNPALTVFGMGGRLLREAGVETIVDSETEASVMGFSEVLSHARKIVRAFRALTAAAAKRRPDVAVFVDFPDFNLRLAKKLSGLGIATVYFISPQLWAWRQGRVKTVKRYIDKVLPIFPFEEGFYQRHGIDAEYIGHPFLDRERITASPAQLRLELGLDPNRPVVALLPGSRKAEINFLLEPLVRSFKIVSSQRPGIQGIIPVAENLDFKWIEREVERIGRPAGLRLVRGSARKVLHAADAAVVASGTATLEAALAKVPAVVVYKLARLTYRIGRLLIRGVQFIAMPNLIAEREIYPELIQSEANAELVANEIERLLGDPARSRRIREQLDLVEERLSFSRSRKAGITACRRAAELVLEAAAEGQGSSGARSRKITLEAESRRPKPLERPTPARMRR